MDDNEDVYDDDSDGGWGYSDRNGSERKEATSGRGTELPSEPSDNDAGETGRYDEHENADSDAGSERGSGSGSVGDGDGDSGIRSSSSTGSESRGYDAPETEKEEYRGSGGESGR